MIAISAFWIQVIIILETVNFKMMDFGKELLCVDWDAKRSSIIFHLSLMNKFAIFKQRKLSHAVVLWVDKNSH